MTTWRLTVADARHGHRDVVLDGEPTSAVADLREALEAAGFDGARATAHGRSLVGDRDLRELGLVHGDTIWCGAGEPLGPTRAPGLYVVVVGGPNAGRFARLGDGPLVIGRSDDVDLALTDPLVGRRHLTIESTTDGMVRVTDLGSGNGTIVDGATISAPVLAGAGSFLQCGATVMAVEAVSPHDLPDLAPVTGSSRPFARRFREALNPLPDRLRAPALVEPDDATHHQSWWRPLLPLLSGVGLAFITKRWEFLAVMALGPVILFFEARRNRRAQRQREVDRLARAERDQTSFRSRLEETLGTEQDRRRRVAPAAGISALHGMLRTRRLWERSAEDPDFGAVTVGLGHLATTINVETSDEAAPPNLWWVPVAVPLTETGSLAVLGPSDRAQAAVRGMVLSLAVSHSPAEVRLWVLADEEHAAAWGFARWLPHSFLDDHGARIATTAPDRAALMKMLAQTLDTRAERPPSSTPAVTLPLDVVVLDWEGVAGDPEVADLLSRGARHGIVGITLSPSVVPEGVHGTVRLDRFADEASFESRHHPRVDSLLVAEVDQVTAEAVARSLASLRPATSEIVSTDTSDVRLLDLLAIEELGETVVAERWRRGGPTTSAIVGLASGTPMTIDLMREGPHGLVGGTTRSGKTEFLKTLFASLCLSNSPDDLSILIVDFKGGVDHGQSAELPHVIALTTNTDIDTFSRTIELLVAEQVRRQAIFREAKSANLDVYNGKRQSRPDLIAVPRLLVVVDEFGELLSTDIGKAHMKTLESVTRVGGGLGLHLLLVTQTFESQLPAQVASNTGLRVCFRVEEASDSKLVLESGLASQIPASRPGRAYGRFHRGDLVEFQAARVAGRRRDLDIGPPPVRLAEVPLGALASIAGEVRAPDVPADEADFASIIDALTSAARATGWRSHAIPWPDELPRRVLLDEVLTGRGPGLVPLGLLDLPERQEQVPIGLGEDDEQVLFVGGPKSDLGDVLMTTTVAASVRSPISDLHIYAIDLANGALAPLAALPHAGGVAVRNEAHALKILRFALTATARRRAQFEVSGVASIGEFRQRGASLPRILVVFSGVERLLTPTDSGVNPLLPQLLRLLSDAPGTGVHVWLAGTSVLGHHRLGTMVSRRFVLPIPDAQEYGLLGVPRAAAAGLDGPRRGFDTQHDRILQFAQLSDSTCPSADVARALGARLAEMSSSVGPEYRPHPVVDVGWPLPVARLDERALRPPAGFDAALAAGLDIESGQYSWLDAIEDGPVLGVAGGSKSGRSSTLLAMAYLNATLGWEAIGIAPSSRSPLRTASGLLRAVHTVKGGPVDVGRLAKPTLILVDDGHRIEMDDLGLEGVLAGDVPVLIVIAGTPDFLAGRTSFLRVLPKIRAGLVLAPSTASDARAFGLQRVPDVALAEGRAGRGLLVVGGEATEIQLPYSESWVQPQFAG